MPWITITPDHLNAYLVAPQLEALRTAALAPGQVDPFVEISTDVISMMRQYIASNPANHFDANAMTVPPELKLPVIHLILAPMLGRLGIDLTEDQRAAVDRAQSTLLALRDRKLVISRADNAIAPPVQSAGAGQVVTSHPAQFTRKNLDWL